MFRFLARRTYKKMMVEEFIREQAKIRVITVAAFKGVSGPSQLNKLAEQMVQEHWDWCRATKDPIGQSLTLSALEEAVNAETLDLGVNMPSVDIYKLITVNDAIWDLLEKRGLVDITKVDEEMPARLRERIDAIDGEIRNAADNVLKDIGSDQR